MGPQGISVLDLATDDVQLVPIAGPRQFAWSPDGSEIVVAHGIDPLTISIVDVATGAARSFAPVAGEVTGPSWSPDGGTIVFTEGETNQLMAAAPDGTDLRTLTTCEDPCTGDDAPSWSADGRTIAFARNFGGHREIATVPATGGEVTLLTTDTELDHAFPDWR
jgi:Tol biopolymer transport system component